MKDNYVRSVLVAASIELIILAGLLTVFFNLSKPAENTNIVINNVQEVTTPAVEIPKPVIVQEVTPPVITKSQQEIEASIVLRMQEISSYRTSYATEEYIFNTIKEKCKLYSAPTNFAWGMIGQESKFYPAAYNKRTHATGLFQICPDGLEDYNLWNGTNYSLNDMFDIELNIEVGVWNLMQQAYYLRREDNVTYKHCVIAFNTGVGDFK